MNHTVTAAELIQITLNNIRERLSLSKSEIAWRYSGLVSAVSSRLLSAACSNYARPVLSPSNWVTLAHSKSLDHIACPGILGIDKYFYDFLNGVVAEALWEALQDYQFLHTERCLFIITSNKDLVFRETHNGQPLEILHGPDLENSAGLLHVRVTDNATVMLDAETRVATVVCTSVNTAPSLVADLKTLIETPFAESSIKRTTLLAKQYFSKKVGESESLADSSLQSLSQIQVPFFQPSPSTQDFKWCSISPKLAWTLDECTVKQHTTTALELLTPNNAVLDFIKKTYLVTLTQNNNFQLFSWNTTGAGSLMALLSHSCDGTLAVELKNSLPVIMTSQTQYNSLLEKTDLQLQIRKNLLLQLED